MPALYRVGQGLQRGGRLAAGGGLRRPWAVGRGRWVVGRGQWAVGRGRLGGGRRAHDRGGRWRPSCPAFRRTAPGGRRLGVGSSDEVVSRRSRRCNWSATSFRRDEPRRGGTAVGSSATQRLTSSANRLTYTRFLALSVRHPAILQRRVTSRLCSRRCSTRPGARSLDGGGW
jgi:hypothetical protein